MGHRGKCDAKRKQTRIVTCVQEAPRMSDDDFEVNPKLWKEKKPPTSRTGWANNTPCVSASPGMQNPSQQCEINEEVETSETKPTCKNTKCMKAKPHKKKNKRKNRLKKLRKEYKEEACIVVDEESKRSTSYEGPKTKRKIVREVKHYEEMSTCPSAESQRDRIAFQEMVLLGIVRKLFVQIREAKCALQDSDVDKKRECKSKSEKCRQGVHRNGVKRRLIKDSVGATDLKIAPIMKEQKHGKHSTQLCYSHYHNLTYLSDEAKARMGDKMPQMTLDKKHEKTYKGSKALKKLKDMNWRNKGNAKAKSARSKND